MSCDYDIILKNGTVIDPTTNKEGIMDIGISCGKIINIAPEIPTIHANNIFDLNGYFVVPGIIDIHIHASEWLGGKFAHKMLAKAGVTTALDMSGPIESVLDFARDYGAGLNIACIQYVRPGYTVANDNPQAEELQELLDKVLTKGSLGLKLLGGHYPLTPESTAKAIEIANKNKAYIAFHAGSSHTGSNIDGFLEAIQLAGNHSLHIAHINSYCRGTVRPCMVETEEAIAALLEHPNIISEAYLSPANGTSAQCTQGVPNSLVTRRCLITGGFSATEEGLEAAIMAGWAQINMPVSGQVILSSNKEALVYWRSMNTDTTVSFNVNPPAPRIRLATAKRPSDKFVVDCISTDGGGIPRNVIAEMGLSLIKLQALSWSDFVRKTSYNPAQILGLKNKGHFRIGADADISVLDADKQIAHMSIANGKVIMYEGYVCGTSSTIITTEQGNTYVTEKGLQTTCIDLGKSAFYHPER